MSFNCRTSVRRLVRSCNRAGRATDPKNEERRVPCVIFDDAGRPIGFGYRLFVLHPTKGFKAYGRRLTQKIA